MSSRWITPFRAGFPSVGFGILSVFGLVLMAGPASAAPVKAAPAATPAAAPAGADAGPRASLEEANARLKKIFATRKPSWSPESEAKNADIRKIVGGFLDFE